MNAPPNNIAPPELARLAVEAYISNGERLVPPDAPEGVLAAQAGAFVTLRTSNGHLRGCIGTIEPSRSNLAEEIIQNAITAATCDPRFAPVTTRELADLFYGVDVLDVPEVVAGPEDLDAQVYGVIIETRDGGRRGLLLPRIEGLETVEQQWLAVHQKAGIAVGTPVRVERFTVTRFGKD
jgi:AmmeMemoRadiSam system protein A